MTTAILILLFLWFPVFMWIREGEVLSSISASTYRLKGNTKGYFTAWLVMMALGMVVYVYQGVMPVWTCLMAIGFTLTGMSPDHRSNPNSLEDAFHTAGTILTIAAGFIGLYLVYSIWIPMAVFIAFSVPMFFYMNNAIWWIECLAMAAIAASLYMI